MYREISCELLDFINLSPTAFHVVDNAKARLLSEGYVELFEENKWELVSGGRYFVTRSMTSLVAFRIPKESFPFSFRATLTHTDSPCLKLKEGCNEKGAPTRLSVELYGGLIQESFLDTPLAVAGRVSVMTDGVLKNKLVNIPNACIIPRTPPHLSKEQKLNPACDLYPLYSMGEKGLIERIARELDVSEKSIVSHDLFCVPCQKGFVWGESNEFLSSPRLDNLQSVYTCLSGFVNSCDETAIPMLALFDNEETGSLSESGADSTFLSDVLMRICEKLSPSFEEYSRALARSFFVSVDSAHALHPNHPELFDKTHAPSINLGPCVKFNASGRYVTNGVSAGIFSEIAKIAGVPTQVYHNRSDIAGGSTLGRFSLSHVSALSLDIGAPLLAMHSSLETAGARDTEYLARIIEMFYSVSIKKENDVYTIN